jgi:hypothetical protein
VVCRSSGWSASTVAAPLIAGTPRSFRADRTCVVCPWT